MHRHEQMSAMKYLLVLFVAGLAALEFYHAYASHDGPPLAMCTAADSNANPLGELLREHLLSHR